MLRLLSLTALLLPIGCASTLATNAFLVDPAREGIEVRVPPAGEGELQWRLGPGGDIASAAVPARPAACSSWRTKLATWEPVAPSVPAVLPVGQFESINRLDAAASDRVSASDLDPCDLLLWSTRSPDGARLSLMALAPLAPPVALAHADVRGHIQPLGYPVLALAFLFDAVTFPIQYVVGKTMSKTVMPH